MSNPAVNAAPSSRADVVIVGAGIGGLAAAIALASAGVGVAMYEAAPRPGGKVRQVQIGAQLLDAGPTVFTMRWVFDELLAAASASLDELLTLVPLRTLARHAWGAVDRPGGSPRLDLHADLAQSIDAIGAFAGAAEARGYRDFCARAQRIYRTLESPFLRAARPTPLSLTSRVAREGLGGLGDLLRISPFDTLWKALGEHFKDPRLRQLFGRYATYCGASPFLAPATLMLVAHVEQSGVWRLEGGMQALADALAAVAVRLGVTLHCGTAVRRVLVDGDRASGIELADSQRIAARAVVFNGDVAALAAGLLGREAQAATDAVPAAQRSQSALTWNLVGATAGFPLLHHNVFFSADYAAEFDDVFGRRRLPREPTVYVCAQDRGDASDPVEARGSERLLCLVNAPPDADHRPLTDPEIAACQARTFERLQRCGLQLQLQDDRCRTTTPSDFAALFPATGGALYGQAPHGWAASFRRPAARSRLAGLYLAGGGTHPGAGVPMAALSGRLAAASLLEDLAAKQTSTGRSRPAATPGGTSTR